MMLISRLILNAITLSLLTTTALGKSPTSYNEFYRQVEEGEKPGILIFCAVWCEPCKQLHSEIDQVLPQFEESFVLYTVDIDGKFGKEVARQFKETSYMDGTPVFGGSIPAYFRIEKLEDTLENSPLRKVRLGITSRGVGYKPIREFWKWATNRGEK